jgi:hypothetical protein
VTVHARGRAKERLGLSTAAIERMAEIALEHGIRHGDTSGGFRRYLDRLYLDYGNANNTRIYGEVVFLFRDRRLITVLHLPHEFKRVVLKIKLRQGWTPGPKAGPRLRPEGEKAVE